MKVIKDKFLSQLLEERMDGKLVDITSGDFKTARFYAIIDNESGQAYVPSGDEVKIFSKDKYKQLT